MTVPNWRANDVTRPVDLVEEVVRFRIEEVPSTLPARDAPSVSLTREQLLRRQVEDVLVGAGYSEAYTWSLVRGRRGQACARGAVHDRDGGAADGSPPGPASSRPSGTGTAGVERIALFEVARVYLPIGEELPEEHWHVAAITEGGFFRAKGAAESLHRALGGAARGARARPGPLRAHETTASSPSCPTAGATSSSTSTSSSPTCRRSFPTRT